MKNTLLKTLITTSIVTSFAIAGGYKLPEQSLNSTALSGAYISNAHGADSSYFNPANMMWNDNISQYELALTYIYLPKVKFKSNNPNEGTANKKSGDSKDENFLMPTFHFTSKQNNGFRYGFSVVSPDGLSKRWNSPNQKASAEEFTLITTELNPTIATKISKNLAIGGGLRILVSKGIVKSNSLDAKNEGLQRVHISRDMDGSSIDYGYNLALTYKAIYDTTIAVTYRSKINLNEEGDATLYSQTLSRRLPETTLKYGTNVTIPIPAALNISVSKKINNTTVELNYEKTYWSAYEKLDFDYDKPIAHLVLNDKFNNPLDKKWKDTNTYRVGVTHKLNQDLTIMGGFSIDKSPVPEATLGYELPDSDAKTYSFGFENKIDDKSSFGIAYLCDIKDERTVKNEKIDGTFSNGGAHLFTLAYKRSF